MTALSALVAVVLLPAAGSQAASDRTSAGEPVNTVLPTISGTAEIGQTLSTSGGTWSSPTAITAVTYTWYRCNTSGGSCAPIAGANTNSYKLTDADAGHTIRVAQAVTNSAGSATATSAATAVVFGPNPVNTAAPAISGTPVTGHTLSTSGGSWSTGTAITAVSYEWRRCDRSGNSCSAISGASGSSYKLSGSDESHTIRVAQTVSNSTGSATAISSATVIVTAHGEPAYVTLPTISGTTEVGQRLSTSGAQWSTLTSISRTTYQWQRCDSAGANCASIGGATSSSYVLTNNDLAHTIRVEQIVTNSNGTATATSNPSGLVSAGGSTAVATAPPAITGTTRVGSTLGTSGAQWSSTTKITKAYYQWLRCDTRGNSCGPIPGAVFTSYRLTVSDLGHTLRVSQTVVNGKGTSSASTSSPTGVVTGGTGAVPATSVRLPDRLVISGLSYSPRVIRNRSPFVARFRVTDTASGRPVSGALVYALGLPYSWVRKGVEVATDANGWATMTILPSRRMPARGNHALVIFVRARVPGQPILRGSSVRRLVQIHIR